MTKARSAIAVLLLVGLLAFASAQPALAHDCSSPRDCEQTAGYNAVIALAGGILALTAGLFGNAIAGGGASQPTGEGDAGTTQVKRRRGCCLGWFTMIASVPAAAILSILKVVGLV